MNNKILFSHNWNNKLDQPYFTTIRNYNNCKYNYYRDKLYNVFDVMLKDKVYTMAHLIGLQSIQYMNIPYGLILLDTGEENLYKQLEIFQKFGMESKESQMIILTFKSILPEEKL